MAAHERTVEAIVLSPDGRWLASGGDLGKTRVWDVQRRQLHATLLTPHRCGSLMFSKDSNFLFTAGSALSGVRLWDISEGTLLREWPNSDSISALSQDPVSERWALLDSKGNIRVFDDWREPPQREVLGESQEWNGHASRGYGLAWSPDGQELASVDRHGSIKLWRLHHRIQRIPVEGPSDRSPFLKITSAGRILVSQLTNQLVEYECDGNQSWSVASRESFPRFEPGPILELPHQHGFVMGGRTSSGNGGLVVVNQVKLSSRTLFVSECPREIVRPCGVSPDGHRVFALACIGDHFEILQIELATGAIEHRFPAGSSTQMAFLDPEGTEFVYSQRNELLTGNSRTGAARKLGAPHQHHLRPLALSPDKSRIAICDDRLIRIVDARTGETIRNVGRHLAEVTELMFVDDGHRILSASRDGTVRLSDPETGLPLLDIYRGERPVVAMEFDRERNRLCFALGDAETRQEIVVLDFPGK